MRKLLLIGALCFGTAGAINLSQLKINDICFVPEINFYIHREVDEIADDILGRMPETAIKVFSDKFIENGFLEPDNCKYSISTDAEVYQFTKNQYTYVTAKLQIYPKTIVDNKKIIISNYYEASLQIKSLDAKDYDFTIQYLLQALVTEFINDWKQAHP